MQALRPPASTGSASVAAQLNIGVVQTIAMPATMPATAAQLPLLTTAILGEISQAVQALARPTEAVVPPSDNMHSLCLPESIVAEDEPVAVDIVATDMPVAPAAVTTRVLSYLICRPLLPFLASVIVQSFMMAIC